jgi:hypothetical protein
MLDAVEQGQKLIKEGSIISAQPLNNFVDWQLELKPLIISDKNPIDNQRGQNVIVTCQECIYINFKGYTYHLKQQPHAKEIDLMDWGEAIESDLLRDYFTDSAIVPYKCGPYDASRFHHIFFESADIDIDLICRNIEVKLKP